MDITHLNMPMVIRRKRFGSESDGWGSYYANETSPESYLSEETPENDQDIDPELVDALNAYSS